MELIKEDEFGKKYQTDKFKIYYKNKNSISGDNKVNVKEEIYLISGKAEVTLETEVKIVEAPTKIEFPENTYHKIKALTKISFILFEK